MLQTFKAALPFQLECGTELPELHLAYHTYGQMNADKSNIIWICHALTANSDAADWWKGLVGSGCTINPERYFIVCVNIPGSCYGSIGPLSLKPDSHQGWFHEFPLITIRDMVRAFISLRKALGIEQIALLAGGSMGGYQAMEWAIQEPQCIQKLFLIATSPAESAWGIAIHTAQRLAIEADCSWKESSPEAGAAGLKAARAIGMLSYRNYEMFCLQQGEQDMDKMEGFRASSYIHYQGDKLVKRFNAYSYYLLTRSMDTHNIARGRNLLLADAIKAIGQPALIMGISTDRLCPVAEQKLLATHMPHARYVEIASPFGHDGFLVETGKISAALGPFLE